MNFHHIAVTSTNIDRTVSWYKSNFDTKIIYQDESWALVKISELMLAFVNPDQHNPHFCFSIKDRSKFSQFGKNIKKHRDGTEYCYINDPDMNTIEILFEDNDKKSN